MDSFPVAPRGYKIVRFLGSGGTANVYLACRPADHRQVALKFPLDSSPESKDTFVELIKREFELVNKLSYPGLTRVFELSDDLEKNPFLSMEYCPGKTLDNIGQIKDIKNLANIISAISINLYYLQLIGLFHGDLKPQNIFLPGDPLAFSRNRLTYAKISDFSLALKADEGISARLGVGTVGYIAPETIEGNTLTHKSDIFALGIMVYLLATGKHPFFDNESDPVRINSMIKEYNPESPRRLSGDIPEELANLILSMLAKKPEDRPLDGFAICQTLEEIGADYPYKLAIRPKHILEAHQKDTNVFSLNNAPFKINERASDRFIDYSGENHGWLRSILEINFSAQRLGWDDGHLIFGEKSNQIIWPRRMQNWVKKSYNTLSYSQKKTAILASLAGGTDNVEKIGIIDKDADNKYLIRPLLYLVRQNLSKSSVRRFSNLMAKMALSRQNNILLAAKLYIQGENLQDGYTVILDAANDVINQNEYACAIELLNDLEHLCRSENDYNRLKFVMMKKADSYKQIGDACKAEGIYLKIIELYHNSPPDKLLGETYKDLGDLYKIKQDYEAGISALEKAERIYSEIGDQLELSHTLNNIGNIYSVNNQLERASVYFRKALRMQKRLGAIKDVASTLNNIGVLYYMRGRWDRIIKILKLSLLLNREIGNSLEIGRVLNNLGSAYFEMGAFDEALGCLKESLSINRKIGNQKELLFNYENLAQVMIAAGTLREAIQFLKDGMSLSSEIADLPHLTNFTGNMAIVLKRMGYYGRAAENLDKAIKAGDKLADRRDLLIWQVTLADLHFRLNQSGKAALELQSALALAKETSDKRARIFIYTLMGFIENDMALIEKAEEISRDLKLERLTSIVKLRKSSLLLKNEYYEDAHGILNGLGGIFSEKEPNIDTSGYFNSLAASYLGMKEIPRAKEFYEVGLKIAERRSLLPEIIEATSNLGKIHTTLREFEAAYNYYRRAIKGLKAMADDINDKIEKISFLSDGKIASLTEEIDKLSQMLSQKRKAGR